MPGDGAPGSLPRPGFARPPPLFRCACPPTPEAGTTEVRLWRASVVPDQDGGAYSAAK